VTVAEAARQVGTVGCLAPEQIEGKPVSPRTDVYALGCLLFECLTGVPPFTRSSPEAVLRAHLHEPPPSARLARPDLPAGVDRVLERALAKWPEERYSTRQELAGAAEAALAGGEQAERAATVERLSPAGLPPHPEQAGEEPRPVAAPASWAHRLGKRGRASIAALGLAVLVAALVAGAVWLSGSETRDPSSQASPAARAEPPGEAAVQEEATATEPPPAEAAAEPVELGLDSPEFYWPVVAAGSLWGSSSTGLLRVDPATERVLARIDGVGPVAAAGKGFLWAWETDGPGFVRVDTETHQAVPIGMLEVPWVELTNADFTVADGAVWASSQGDRIRRLDPVTGEETERIRVGRRLSPLVAWAGFWAPIAAGAGAVWAANQRDGTVTRYELPTGRIETIDVTGTPNALVFADGSIWVGVQPLTREEYAARAEAICKAANDRFYTALPELNLPEVVENVEDLVAANEVELRFSEDALAQLRAIPLPGSDREELERELSLREQEVDVMRQIAAAAAAGDAARAEALAWERVDLTHQRNPGGYLGAECPVALGA
jgi:hypothetical protein